MTRPAKFLIAVTLSGQALAAKPVVATPTGEPVNCIEIVQIDHSRVRDDQTIDFIMRGRKQVYRNVLPAPCPELGIEQAFSYETSLSRLCNTDIITVFRQAGIRRGTSCGLGDFQPVALDHVD